MSDSASGEKKSGGGTPTPPKEEPESATPSSAENETKNEKENKTPLSPEPKANGDAEGGAAKPTTLREQFRVFSKFGIRRAMVNISMLSQSDKWMKQAKVIDGKTITTTDTAIHFKKFKQMKITYQDYEKYLADLAKAKNIEVSELKNKLRSCGAPGTSGTTAVVKNQAVDRLTDTKKYTGSHKIRADTPTKGKVSPSPRK